MRYTLFPVAGQSRVPGLGSRDGYARQRVCEGEVDKIQQHVWRSHTHASAGAKTIIIERLQLRHKMTSRLLPYGKKSRSSVENYCELAGNGAATAVV